MEKDNFTPHSGNCNCNFCEELVRIMEAGVITHEDEQIQEDKDEQFEAMDYTVECNTCGEKIRRLLLSNDFNRTGLIKDLQDAMEAHNMTHYEKPIIHRCKDDDIFGVDHSECNHRVTVNADGSF